MISNKKITLIDKQKQTEIVFFFFQFSITFDFSTARGTDTTVATTLLRGRRHCSCVKNELNVVLNEVEIVSDSLHRELIGSNRNIIYSRIFRWCADRNKIQFCQTTQTQCGFHRQILFLFVLLFDYSALRHRRTK